MRILGLDITRAATQKALSPPWERNSAWFPVIREGFTGAWQRNIIADVSSVTSFHAIFACSTLISHDISKLRVKLLQLQSTGIWQETTNSAYDPVLRDPNPYQNDHQFWESWILSKLNFGNTYVLKARDARNVVNGLYVLNPDRVRPLVADDGSVFYRLSSDNLSRLPEDIIVPAREIIHDRWNCIFHPLIGHSPIYAAGLAAMGGLRIQNNSEAFFRKSASPSGLLVAPGHIEEGTVKYLSEYFNENFGGDNSGKVAVVGDNLKFQQMSMSAVDSQLIEQLKWDAEIICGVYHVPPYKIGLGVMPAQTGIESLNIEYYSQALQKLLEDGEGCLDRGLSLASDMTVEFDLDGLFRMDTLSKIEALNKAVGAGIFAPNEARMKFNLPPVPGGASPYLQQQNYSLEALAKRDAQADPFGTNPLPAPAPAPAPAPVPPPNNQQLQNQALLLEIYRGLS